MEFVGDSILNTYVTTEIIKSLTHIEKVYSDSPFQSKCGEGDLSSIRQEFINKDYLASRFDVFNLSKYVLLGSNEQLNDSIKEDIMESIIGAVYIDSNFDLFKTEGVIDTLLSIQVQIPNALINNTYYRELNKWHQKKFNCLPEYRIDNNYFNTCTITYINPKNNIKECITGEGETRSISKEHTAEFVVRRLQLDGVWMNLEDANMTPCFEDSINQLQELFQKKYIEKPEYVMDNYNGKWHVRCIVEGTSGYGTAPKKTLAKKRAAYMTLVRLFSNAGITNSEWDEVMKSYMYEF